MHRAAFTEHQMNKFGPHKPLQMQHIEPQRVIQVAPPPRPMTASFVPRRPRPRPRPVADLAAKQTSAEQVEGVRPRPRSARPRPVADLAAKQTSTQQGEGVQSVIKKPTAHIPR